MFVLTVPECRVRDSQSILCCYSDVNHHPPFQTSHPSSSNAYIYCVLQPCRKIHSSSLFQISGTPPTNAQSHLAMLVRNHPLPATQANFPKPSPATLSAVDACLADLAVVVVGELLSEEFTSMSKTKAHWEKPVFDSTKHTTLPPFADARVLVRRLSEEDANLLICMKTMALVDFCCFQPGWKSKLFTIASGLRGIGSAGKLAKDWLVKECHGPLQAIH